MEKEIAWEQQFWIVRVALYQNNLAKVTPLSPISSVNGYHAKLSHKFHCVEYC